MVACTTTNAFWGRELRSRVLRLAPRSASAGLARDVSHAGAVPKSSPVISDNPKAKARMGSEGVALMGTNCALRKANATTTFTPR